MNTKTKNAIKLFIKTQDKCNKFYYSDAFQRAKEDKVEAANKKMDEFKNTLECLKKEIITKLDKEREQLELATRKLQNWNFRDSEIRPIRVTDFSWTEVF
jgi:predicted nuclease with TOPRIM domain